MQLKTLCLSILCLTTFGAFAQEEGNITTDVTKLTFFNPGFSYEKSIGQKSTLHGHLFLNTSISYSYSSSFGGDFDASLDPALLVQYRYYYNYKQRQQKGKRTDKNSLNYISPTFQSVYSKNAVASDHLVEFKRRPINVIGVVWGLQRNYAKRFSLDLNLGLGYLFTTVTVQGTDQTFKENVGQVTMPRQINLGFWLNRQ
jgi:hypothetical protein